MNDKKKSRAERFGLPASNGGGAKKGATPVDPEMDAKKKSRAERFGLTVNQKRVSSINESFNFICDSFMSDRLCVRM